MRNIYYSKPLEVDIIKQPGSIENALYSVKRDLILFDQIVYPNLNNRLKFVYDHYRMTFGQLQKIQIAEFDYLQESELVKDYKLYEKIDSLEKLIQNLDEVEGFQLESFLSFAGGFSRDFSLHYQKYQQEKDLTKKTEILKNSLFIENMLESATSLASTAHMRYVDNLDAINSQRIQKGSIAGQKTSTTIDKSTVYSLLLGDLPLPADNTPWQDILDYKSDRENVRRLASLRKWIGNITKGECSETELVDEYEAFYLDFESAINRHRIKTKKTWLKILIVGGMEIVEDVMKLRLKSISEKIFKNCLEASTENIELEEAEASAPGRELTYMFFSKEKFTQ